MVSLRKLSFAVLVALAFGSENNVSAVSCKSVKQAVGKAYQCVKKPLWAGAAAYTAYAVASKGVAHASLDALNFVYGGLNSILDTALCSTDSTVFLAMCSDLQNHGVDGFLIHGAIAAGFIGLAYKTVEKLWNWGTEKEERTQFSKADLDAMAKVVREN